MFDGKCRNTPEIPSGGWWSAMIARRSTALMLYCLSYLGFSLLISSALGLIDLPYNIDGFPLVGISNDVISSGEWTMGEHNCIPWER